MQKYTLMKSEEVFGNEPFFFLELTFRVFIENVRTSVRMAEDFMFSPLISSKLIGPWYYDFIVKVSGVKFHILR